MTIADAPQACSNHPGFVSICMLLLKSVQTALLGCISGVAASLGVNMYAGISGSDVTSHVASYVRTLRNTR